MMTDDDSLYHQIFMIDGCIIWMYHKAIHQIAQLRVMSLSLLSHQWVQWLSAGATILAGIPVAQVLGGCAGWSGSQKGRRSVKKVLNSAFGTNCLLQLTHPISRILSTQYPPYVLDHGFLGAFKLGDRDYASWRQIRVILQLLRKSWKLLQASYNQWH